MEKIARIFWWLRVWGVYRLIFQLQLSKRYFNSLPMDFVLWLRSLNHPLLFQDVPVFGDMRCDAIDTEKTHSFLPTWTLLPMQNLDISNSDGSFGFHAPHWFICSQPLELSNKCNSRAPFFHLTFCLLCSLPSWALTSHISPFNPAQTWFDDDFPFFLSLVGYVSSFPGSPSWTTTLQGLRSWPVNLPPLEKKP